MSSPPPLFRRARAQLTALPTAVTTLALAATTAPPAAELAHHRATRHAWATLLARL